MSLKILKMLKLNSLTYKNLQYLQLCNFKNKKKRNTKTGSENIYAKSQKSQYSCKPEKYLYKQIQFMVDC